MEPSVPGPSTAQTRPAGGAENTNKQQPTPTKTTSQRQLRPKEFKKQMLQKMVMLEGKRLKSILNESHLHRQSQMNILERL